MKIRRVLKVTQYIKIDTLWKRDPINWYIIDDDYSNPIFDNIIRWTATACPMVLDRAGTPVKFKLKVKDYQKLRCVK